MADEEQKRIFFKNLNKYLSLSNKTQKEIAHILGTSQTMYARYERGASELPIRHLLALCSFYHVSADYILGLTDSPTPYKR